MFVYDIDFNFNLKQIKIKMGFLCLFLNRFDEWFRKLQTQHGAPRRGCTLSKYIPGITL